MLCSAVRGCSRLERLWEIGHGAHGCVSGLGYEGRARALVRQLEWRQGKTMEAHG